MADQQQGYGGGNTPEVLLNQLISLFNPPIDEAVIRSIASDYDLLEEYATVHAQLGLLAETAQAEEATGFDPSGLGHLSDDNLGQFGVDDVTPESQPSSDIPGSTSMSDLSDGFDTPCFTYQTELSEEDKLTNLRMIFANFPDHTLKFELKQAKGDQERAFESLLSRQYLEENNELPKGVEGFYVADENDRPRRSSRKRQQKPGRQQLPVTYQTPRLDAEGLVEALSISATPGRLKQLPQPPAQQGGHRTIVLAPQTLAERRNEPISHLPRPLTTSNTQTAIPPHGWRTVAGKKRSPKASADGPPPVPGATGPSFLEQAGAMRRKGGLYRQGAVVYDERGREEKQRLRGTSMADYRQLVAEQSNSHKTDLHGVPVLEGVKIAKDRVQEWWDGLDQGERERRPARSGITVITGVGYHSTTRGDSQLRRAVGAMLKNDGWKFETLTGQFHVTGKAI